VDNASSGEHKASAGTRHRQARPEGRGPSPGSASPVPARITRRYTTGTELQQIVGGRFGTLRPVAAALPSPSPRGSDRSTRPAQTLPLCGPFPFWQAVRQLSCRASDGDVAGPRTQSDAAPAKVVE